MISGEPTTGGAGTAATRWRPPEIRSTERYVELHASSAFSFLRGATQPEELVAEALRLKLPALAVLDRDGVYGTPRVHTAACDTALRPIVGAELTVEDGSVLPLLVMNQQGYRNLSRLISTAKLEPRPREVVERAAEAARRDASPYQEDLRERKRPCYATWAELAAHAEGLVALTGDEEGPLRRAWAAGGLGAAEQAIARLEGIFGGGRLAVEVQRRRIRGETTVVRRLADLAAARRLPLVATGGVRYATRAERPVADVFTCLRNHTTLDGTGRLLEPNGERHLRGAGDMAELFADLPEAVANSVRLAQRLEFTLQDLGYQFPDFPVGAGETMEGVLRERVHAGARERFHGVVTEKIARQIETELALIEELGFTGYFLIIWDICKWTRQQGILVQGRGSAANSVVCYALGITAVDPTRFELLFDRFLSRGRIGKGGHPSWPDVDLDLPSGDRREKVIQEVYRRYAPRGAAMVANVITYRGRSTMREVGKVLGFSEDLLGRFSALYGNGDFPHTLDVRQQVAMTGLRGGHPRLAALLGLYHQIKGLPRHLGQHSGGMVLCPNRLDTVVPIEPATMEQRCVVQWDKDDCEELGLVKIDFLGLGMMAVLQETFALCGARGPATFTEIPPEDPETYRTACAADTIGVFQIESRAQMATLPRFQPQNLYDLAMQVSIVRPGPIVGKLVHPLIRRRHGLEDVEYLDPSIEHLVKPILERTMGVILFQEQMLKIAMDVAGFDGSQAEELRRAMGFTKRPERLAQALVKLRASMQARGIKEAVIDKVVNSCRSFAAYGFPESHAISFALLAYASTWLKVHRLAEFTASLLNNQPMGFYSPATLLQDGRRHGLKVRPVCVAASQWACTVEGENVMRLGLRQVRCVQEKRVRAMLVARAERPFASMNDFLARTTFTAAERRALAAVGALQSLAEHRRAALWQIEAAWSADESLLQRVEAEQAVLPLAPMTRAERIQADFRGLSLTVGEHPMALVRARLPEAWRAADLPLGRDGDRVKIAGSVICRQRPGTAKGVVFVSLEDETGIANAIVAAELFERRRLVINEEPALRIAGRLQIQAGVIHVRAETIEALDLREVPAQASHDFR